MLNLPQRRCHELLLALDFDHRQEFKRRAMSSPSPLIEELPDDYDVQAEKERVWSAVLAPPAPSEISQPDGKPDVGAMRKGFFSTKLKPSAPARSTKLAPAVSSASSAAACAGTCEPPADVSLGACEAGSGAEVGEVVAGLRARLLQAVSDARKARRQGDVAECAESLKRTVAAMASQPRWPSSQARSAGDRAAREAGAALAELRAASNDARRLRSGEEKRALAELRRAADDGVDRVGKLCESVAPRDRTPESETTAVVAAFHSLPLTAKLRLLASERAAVALALASLALGGALMCGILLEFYAAWGCGFQCER